MPTKLFFKGGLFNGFHFIYFFLMLQQLKMAKTFICIKRNHLYAKLQLLLIGIQMNKSRRTCWGFFLLSYNGNLDFLSIIELRIPHSVVSWSLQWIESKKQNSKMMYILVLSHQMHFALTLLRNEAVLSKQGKLKF